MAIEMRLSPSLRQELQLSHRFSNEDYEYRYFGLFTTRSWAYCPGCGYQLNEMEIRAGFSNDPIELRTTCPKCNKMFMAEFLIKDLWDEKKTLANVDYYCPEQTLHKMITIIKTRKRLGVKFLSKYDRELYYNMVWHWDTYDRAIRVLKSYMGRKFLQSFDEEGG